MNTSRSDLIHGVAPVGFVGLGLMGKPMALNLVAAGLNVRVWNRSAPALATLVDAGAHAAASLADLADCDVIFFMLPDLVQIKESIEPILNHWRGGLSGEKYIVVCSSVSPAGIQEFGATLESEFDGRIHVLDAPVSGGTAGAEAGKLAIMVGGTVEDFNRTKPLLETMGSTVQRMGELGAGSVAKACNQLVVGVTTAALAEATVIAERNDLDLNALFEVLAAGLAGSNVLTMMGPRLADEDYEVRGPAKFMVKDLASVAQSASSAGLELTLVSAAATMYRQLVEQGLGDLDLSVIRRSIELAQESDSPTTTTQGSAQ